MAEKKINGRTFRIADVLATDAIKLQVRLLKVIGGGVDRLPAIMAGMGKKGEEDPAAKEASNTALVAALADIFTKADPDGVTDLISAISGHAQLLTPSGSWNKVDVDQDFTADKKSLFPFLGWVLKEILGDFFADVRGAGDLRKMVTG